MMSVVTHVTALAASLAVPVVFPKVISVIAVPCCNFLALQLQSLPPDDPVLLASIPDYPDTTHVELPNNFWPFVSTAYSP